MGEKVVFDWLRLRKHLLELFAIYCLALALTIALQWRNAAFDSEFTRSSDESAHYVTGLMFRDYIAEGLPQHPMAYATEYYDRYPRIALGQFPPFFYVLQAFWTIPFGVSRVSIIILMAAISASLLTTTYTVCTRHYPRLMSVALMIFLAGLPSMQLSSSAVMAETLVALLVFWSILVLERYFALPNWHTALSFGLLAAATLLTKGTGIVLALVPIPAAILIRGGNLLRRASFWGPAFVVAALCSPWFLTVPGALHERVAKFGGIIFRPMRILDSFAFLGHQLSDAGLALALTGIASILYKIRHRTLESGESELRGRSFWCLAIVLVVSTLVLRMFIGAWEQRHLLTILPFLVVYIGAGLSWVVDMTFRRNSTGIVLAIGALAGIFMVNVSHAVPKEHLGLDKVAQEIVTDSRFRNSRLLIASDTVGEGAFVAEIAMRELRPGHFVERGSKVLAEGNFMGDQYQLKFHTPADLMNFLDAETGRLIILDAPPDPLEHVQLIRRTILEYPNRWLLIGKYPRDGNGKSQDLGIRMYMVAHNSSN